MAQRDQTPHEVHQVAMVFLQAPVDPADRVVGHARRDDGLPQIAPHQVHVHEHARDHGMGWSLAATAAAFARSAPR